MAALTGPRDVKPRMGEKFNDPVKGSTLIYKGAAVLKDGDGYLINAASGAVGVPRGVAMETVDNSAGADGAKRCEVRSGWFEFHILGASAVDDGDCEQIVYFDDNQTVAKVSGGTRPAAGRLKGVDPAVGGGIAKAIVAVGPLFSVDGDLVAANNLSDVADASTAAQNLGALEASENLSDVASASTSRTNLGLGDSATGRTNLGVKMVLVMVIDTLVGSGVTRLALPDLGGSRPITIEKLESSLQGALTVGDATLTFSINGAAITGGVITITQAGSAAGDRDEATPSAANVSDGADDELRCTLGGTNTADVKAIVTITCSY